MLMMNIAESQKPFKRCSIATWKVFVTRKVLEKFPFKSVSIWQSGKLAGRIQANPID
jgi:hypothetical protein